MLDALDEATDLAPLAQLLADPQVEVIVHAGRQDIALLASLCAHRGHPDLRHSGRGRLRRTVGAGRATTRCLREVLGVRVQKTASYTRWDRRPLDAEQLAYAREDVLHLLDLAAELERRLSANGRLGLGARGVPLPRARQRRARHRHGLRAAAAGQLALPLRAGDRARARGMARAGGRAPGSPGDDCAQRRRAGRTGEARTAHARATRAGPRRQPRQPAPTRHRSARHDRSRRRSASDPGRGRAPRGRAPRSTGPRSPSPRRSCAHGRSRRGSPTS